MSNYPKSKEKAGGKYGEEEGKNNFSESRNSQSNNKRNKRSRGKFGGSRERQEGNGNLHGIANNPSWYAADPNLLNAAASFNYAWPTGNAIDLGPYANKIHLGSVPGIMTISIDPQVGYSDNQNSPITLASRELYAFVRYANAGHSNYDPPDLLMYAVAMDSCYSFYSFLRRIYGVCRTYSNVNRYYPKAIIEAMGVDFDDIYANLANLNYTINVFATMFSRLNVPAGMSYITKHMWMYDNVYTDANTPRGQTYMFVPRSLFKFKRDAQGAGMLERIVLDPYFNSELKPSMSYADLITTMNTLMDPVVADEDIGIMSGDILKAYGAEGCIKVSGVTFDYGVSPVYNLEVLEIINNTTLLGPATGNITQNTDIDGGYIKSTPVFTHYDASIGSDQYPGMNAIVCDRFINFKRDNITPQDSMVVTRLMNIGEAEGYDVENHAFICKTIASETAAFARVFWYGRDGDSATGDWVLRWTKPFTISICFSHSLITALNSAEKALAANNTTLAQTLIDRASAEYAERTAYFNRFVELVSQFDFHPPLGLSSYAAIEANSYNWADSNQSRASVGMSFNELNGFVYDLGNYAIVGKSNLQNLAEVALLNMFHLGMGKR